MVYHSTPFPCLGRRKNFLLENFCYINDVGGDYYWGAHGRGDSQRSPYRYRGGGYLHRSSLQCLPLLLPRLAEAQRLYAYRCGWCRRRCRPDGRRAVVISDNRWASSQPRGCWLGASGSCRAASAGDCQSAAQPQCLSASQDTGDCQASAQPQCSSTSGPQDSGDCQPTALPRCSPASGAQTVPDAGTHGQPRSGPGGSAGPAGSDGCSDAVLYPVLPDAIAPSLATTPEFARRGTIWCHASEVMLSVSLVFKF